MSRADYYICPACDQKALYDGRDEEQPAVVVLHEGCYERLTANRGNAKTQWGIRHAGRKTVRITSDTNARSLLRGWIVPGEMVMREVGPWEVCATNADLLAKRDEQAARFCGHTYIGNAGEFTCRLYANHDGRHWDYFAEFGWTDSEVQPDELCSDKNGFHDPHDWRPDPCDPGRWCPGRLCVWPARDSGKHWDTGTSVNLLLLPDDARALRDLLDIALDR